MESAWVLGFLAGAQHTWATWVIAPDVQNQWPVVELEAIKDFVRSYCRQHLINDN
jgi:hypothetical protein